jgi:hypothetical protein
MLETCRGSEFLTNWVKSASCWIRYTDIRVLWCTVSKTLRLLQVLHYSCKRDSFKTTLKNKTCYHTPKPFYTFIDILSPLNVSTFSRWEGLRTSVTLQAMPAGTNGPGRVYQTGQAVRNKPDWEKHWSSKNGGFADGLVTLPRKTKYP